MQLPRSLKLVLLSLISVLLILIFANYQEIFTLSKSFGSFAQGQTCSKECQLDNPRSCSTPYVCKPKCSGTSCSLKVGTCEYFQCPSGKMCGCEKPIVTPWVGHEDYPPAGYSKLKITLDIKSPFYHPDLNTGVILMQKVISKEKRELRAFLNNKVSLTQGQKTLLFDNVPSRETELILENYLDDTTGYNLDYLDDKKVTIDFGQHCTKVERFKFRCNLSLEQNKSYEINIKMQIKDKIESKDNFFAYSSTSLVGENNDSYLKMYICDKETDSNCQKPEESLLRAYPNTKDPVQMIVKKLSPGRKKLFFDTTSIFDSNGKVKRKLDDAHLGFFRDHNNDFKIDWHKPYDYFVPAFDKSQSFYLQLRLAEQNTLKEKIRSDSLYIILSGRPKGISFIKAIPCGFVGQSAQVQCFDNEGILKRVSKVGFDWDLVNFQSKYIGWTVDENLYNETGVPTGEKLVSVKMSKDCLELAGTQKNVCVFDPLRNYDYSFSLLFANNKNNNQNLTFHDISFVNYDPATRAELKANYANAYLQAKICNTTTDCDNLYPKLVKVVKGAYDNGDILELPPLDFAPGQFVQLDDFLYNESGQVVAPIPKNWNIKTTCTAGSDPEFISNEKNTCRFGSEKWSTYNSSFVLTIGNHQPQNIPLNLQVFKPSSGDEITSIERFFCLTQLGYQCQKLDLSDYKILSENNDSLKKSENILLIQYLNSFNNKKTPFLAETKYFVKYSVSAGSQNYESIFEVEAGAKNEFVMDLNKLTPISNNEKPIRKVKILLHDYFLPSQNKFVFDFIGKNTDYAKNLANQVAQALSLPNNPVKFEIVDYVTLNSFPKLTKNNDRELIEKLFLQCKEGNFKTSACEQIPPLLGQVDYVELEKDLSLCSDVNEGKFDELWHVNMPYTPVGEDDIFGPYPININGIVTKIDKCQKNVPTLGIDILSPVSQAMHSFGHRAESLKFVFDDGGDWATPPKSIFEEFILSDYSQDKSGKIHEYSGCGGIHFPPNVTQNSLYNYRKTNSICDNFLKYDPPSIPLQKTTKSIDCSEWGCTGEGYYTWWLSHLPKGVGKDQNGKMNDWWQYVIYTENMVRDSVIAKLMALDNNKNGIFDSADFADLQENYTSNFSKKSKIIDTNNDSNLNSIDLNFYKNKIGTLLPETESFPHKHKGKSNFDR